MRAMVLRTGRHEFLTLATALALVFGLAALPTQVAHANDLPIGETIVVDEDPEPPPEEEDPPMFYDEEIPQTSESVIYVVDRSASMTLGVGAFTGPDGQPVANGTRLDFVKAELTRSIRTLPENFTFNIVLYSECVETWKPARMKADPGVKSEAIGWVNAIQPWGWTNTAGGTARALADHGNRVVMLLSDGAPNFLDCAQSNVGDFDTHRRVIHQSNIQDATIHCFGIGLDPETRTFMQAVASENKGTFRELD
jgi:hypothetical protein